MGIVEQPTVGWQFMSGDPSLEVNLTYGRDDMLLFVKMLECS